MSAARAQSCRRQAGRGAKCRDRAVRFVLLFLGGIALAALVLPALAAFGLPLPFLFGD
jgi:hypothetical protein